MYWRVTVVPVNVTTHWTKPKQNVLKHQTASPWLHKVMYAEGNIALAMVDHHSDIGQTGSHTIYDHGDLVVAYLWVGIMKIYMNNTKFYPALII